MSGGCDRRRGPCGRWNRLSVTWTALALLLLAAGARAQDSAPADSDSLNAPPAGGLLAQVEAAEAQAEADGDSTTVTDATTSGFLQSVTNAPKAGIKANVRQQTYYAEWQTDLSMARSSTFKNLASWSWDEFRRQDKTVERRKSTFTYNLGELTPLVMSLTGRWDWNEDKTTNTAGFANLLKIDTKSLGFNATKTKFAAAGLTNSLRLGASLDDQASINLGQRNDFTEGTLRGGWQSGWAIADGVVLAGRVHGGTTSGERFLAGESQTSSALNDSMGIGVYYERDFASGLVAVTRSNFEKKYLDFRRNANGLVDTNKIDEALKVVDELETKDALSLKFKNELRLGRLGLRASAEHTTDNLNYAASLAGRKEKLQDLLNLGLTFAVGRDSLGIDYEFGWAWDDQRIKFATANRGRQYMKRRDVKVNWYRRLFVDTRLKVQYHEGLLQDIAQYQHNENDKDRLTSDFTTQLERSWADRLRTKLVYSFRQTKDLSIRDSRSANSNIKDSYEIAPGYTWTMSPWLTLDQNFRLYIQYTNYYFAGLEAVTRSDNYNKRGNLTTKVTLKPSERLTVVLRNDYNKRFNATKTSEDVTGDSFYNRDQNQTLSTIDVDLKFTVVDGFNLQLATFRTRDDRTNFGRSVIESRNDSGEMMVGAGLDRKWGATNPLELSALVKKFNAFGPSVTVTSADYWEADVWLKWGF